MIKLADIAARLGVSKATVSLALRESPRISEATRHRVQTMAKELGYRPNPLVSAFLANHPARRDRAVYLNYVIPWPQRSFGLERPYFAEIYLGLKTRAAEMGFHFQPILMGDEANLPGFFRGLQHRGVDGIILAPFRSPRHCLDPELLAPFPVVAIGQSLHSPHIHRIATDNSHNMTLLLERLLERGYKRIGLVIPKSHDERNQFSWSQSWRGFLQRHRLPFKGLAFLVPDTLPPPDVFRKWLHRAQPDSIILSEPVHFDYIQAHTGPIPESIGVACVDIKGPDRHISGYLSALENIGRVAIEVLADLINHNQCGVPAIPRRILIEGVWNEGQTLRKTEAPSTR